MKLPDASAAFLKELVKARRRSRHAVGWTPMAPISRSRCVYRGTSGCREHRRARWKEDPHTRSGCLGCPMRGAEPKKSIR